MGFFADRWEEASRRLIDAVTPHLAPGEQLVGIVHVTQPKTFSADVYAVGVTADRLIVLPVNRKLQPDGDPISVRREDITKASVWGHGGSARDLASLTADQQLRFATADRSFKLNVLGGTLLEDSLSGPTQRSGLEELIAFLLSASR